MVKLQIDFMHSLELNQISKLEVCGQSMPTDNDLTRCSRYITIPRSSLAGFLDIETSVVVDIKNRFTGKSVQKYQILKKWVSQHSVTKQEAHDKLKAMGQEKAAKRLCLDNIMTVLLPVFNHL